MSLFSDAWREKDSETLEEEGMVSLNDNSIKAAIGSPTELVDDLKGSINQSLGEYAKWTTTGLMTAVKDPLTFAERQRTMAHPYFRNPDDQLVRDNVQNMIAEMEANNAILDAAQKSALLARVEEVGSTEGASAAEIGERVKAIGDMLDAYKAEKNEDFNSVDRLRAIKQWNSEKINRQPGWFYTQKGTTSWEHQPHEKMAAFDYMPIGEALKEINKHSERAPHPKTGKMQNVAAVPFQTMLHLTVGDAFVNGLRVAKIKEWTTPAAKRNMAIGLPMPHNFDGDDEMTEVAEASNTPAYEAAKKVAERAAKQGMPVGNVFADAVAKVKEVIPFGKKAKTEDEVDLDAALAGAIGSKKESSVLLLVSSGPASSTKNTEFSDAMKADLSSDRNAMSIATHFDAHAMKWMKQEFNLDFTKSKFSPEAGALVSADGTAHAKPFMIEKGAHIGAALVNENGITHQYDASQYGYKLVRKGDPSIHEVSMVHLAPKASGDVSRTFLMHATKPAIGGQVFADRALHTPAMKVTFPSAKDPKKELASGHAYGADYVSASNNHRANVRVVHFH